MSETVDVRLLGEQVRRLQQDTRELKESINLLARTLPGQVQVMVVDLRTALGADIHELSTTLTARMDAGELAIAGQLEQVAGNVALILQRLGMPDGG